MKQLTTYILISCLFGCLISTQHIQAQTTIAYHTFSTGFEGWQDGGYYSGRNFNANSCTAYGALYTYYNSYSSVVTSPAYNLSAYSEVTISFCTLSSSNLESTDGFDLEYFDGLNWYRIGVYRYGADNLDSQRSFSVTLNSAFINLPNNAVIRFVGRNSRTNEWNVYDDIEITGILGPEIEVSGNGVGIADNDTAPSATDNTDFGAISTGTNLDHSFTIYNTGNAPLNLTGGTNLVSVSGNAAFSVQTQPSSSVIAPGSSSSFVIRFAPTVAGTVTATVSINNNDSNENPFNFIIQGTGVLALSSGPGGVTNDLALWLKSNSGLSYSSGNGVSLWADQGRGANATVHTAGQEPTYLDTPQENVNFNPVIKFENSFTTVSTDSDYSYDNTNTQFLEGSSGLYTQDMFVVFIPDDTELNNSFGFMDVFCGDADITTNASDATGIGFGNYTGRISNETISFALDTYNSSIPNNGYAVQDGPNTSYNNVGIINARNNGNGTRQQLYYNATDIEYRQNDIASFVNVNNSRFWIGRSEGWEASLNGRMCEIITYSSRKNDANLTQERNRIQSYLAIKYGITLGTNGVSQNYVSSDGTVIWNQAHDTAFNYDIAGIGRDDDSNLLQKQSRSVNNALDGATRGQGVLTMGVGSISNTNSSNNSSALSDKSFLMWGNNGVDLDNAARIINIDLSADLSPTIPGGTRVQMQGIARTWQVVETVAGTHNIPEVEVAILRSAIRTVNPTDGQYAMFISDTPDFSSGAEVRLMSDGFNELGTPILKTNYDFTGTKYITFGWAPLRQYERSVYFNGRSDYIKMPKAYNLNASAFTLSAWVNRASTALNSSIISKRNASYSQGYDFKINAMGRFEVSWKAASGTLQRITSNTVIPAGTWHHLAIIYESGEAKLYIDGILDNQAPKQSPPTTNEVFLLGAAAAAAPEAYFTGFIDEVRVWNTALTEAQMRFIMNQEIENNSGFVGGSYFIANSMTPTKNDIASVPWSNLIGYYPMSSYLFTNTLDHSGNGHMGALNTLRTVAKQTAPLPYISDNHTNWNIASTWKNGALQTIPGGNAIADTTKTINWNIVETRHNISIDNTGLAASSNGNRQLLALHLANNTVTVLGNNILEIGFGLTVSHFLQLSGKLDLEGESQLIQTTDSDLVVGSNGILEKDQQGTSDLYTYNYWSSPVGITDTSSNNTYSFTLNDHIMKDGTNPLNPVNISYINGYDGSSSGTNLQIAHYWIWKFNNRLTDDYPSWQHVRNTGTILAGEGFTMKGATNTLGNIHQEQNYVFHGKPNNGPVSLPINAGNEYLIGNPYASAMDAQQFMRDNGPTPGGPGNDMLISGTLYFWEHWGGGSHVLAEYQGGYAAYNFSGGTPAVSIGASNPYFDNGGTPTKTPGRYIPVGQGFFVAGVRDGNLNFNNGQRRFVKEGTSSSIFIRQTWAPEETEDTRMKIRLGFQSVNSLHRQLLVTADTNATLDSDWGYDAPLNEVQVDDMSWLINNDKYTIQGINAFLSETILPLQIKTSENGEITIGLDRLEYIPDNLAIYLHDKDLGIYHNLRTAGAYTIYVTAGNYENRFEVTFNNGAVLDLSEPENQANLQVYYANNSESLIINNPNLLAIETLEIMSVLGQRILRITDLETTHYHNIKLTKVASGAYIIKLRTANNGTLSKKVIIK
ncbi:LamG-like jellyroll fold domain-containing protein [Bizionia sediminis]|uniref:LamG-like jellyroll fold domain-containing protein n=1 Tax=Bizionia sediminis TaxID=1737064 RepID=A0ABW5KTS5_9FLAO